MNHCCDVTSTPHTSHPGTCDVDGVTLLLVQEMIYTCNLGEGDEERQKKEVNQ